MASRLELHEILCDILGSKCVYFQPPESVKMQYPAIVYSRQNIENDFANDSIYVQSPSYKIVLIDKNPDSVYIDKILNLPYCRFDRHYTSDNLNHDVFTLYNQGGLTDA